MITLEINNQLPRRMDLFSAIERTDYHQNVKDDLVLFFMDKISIMVFCYLKSLFRICNLQFNFFTI